MSRRQLLVGLGVAGIVLVGVVVVVFLVGGGSKHTITGTMVLVDTTAPLVDCVGTGGYEDIRPGAAVVIRDGDGQTLATGHLGAGVPEESAGCTYPFSVEVADSDFYRIEVTHRGELEYSKEELEGANWHVSATLGSG